MSQRVQEHLAASAGHGHEVLRAGLFTLTISGHDPGDVEAFRSRDRQPRLEYPAGVSGEPVGGGVAIAVRDGISEVAGIAARPKHERRGIGGALTPHLTRAAHAAGATLVFLTPGGDAQERVCSSVGYRRTDSVLLLSKE
ncbi:GNAT family N-acetyltransferase [Dactylosporangium sp. NPDC005572]|uniref:GNAT family N-acetyltransferase n=1 Tax=Dactylosporangium sp. NPDC005572 TaxID=3156889 RepID=UPI0033BBE296